MSWIKGWRRRLRALVHKEAAERELDEELRFHLEMETEKNLRAGMGLQEAKRQAVLEFGGVERFKEEVRDARALAWTAGMSLDIKLGLRMLVKYPALALIGGLGMVVAVAIGAGSFAFLYSYMLPTLPLDEGNRVVGIEQWDASANRPERQSLYDFGIWRNELESVQDLGAFRTTVRNLIVAGRQAEPVPVAEMTASGFRVARVPPLLGRPLVAADEREGAPPVVVIGHDVWRKRFASDPSVVGRDVHLGSTVYTVVGVMPEGFAFPVSHSLWTPLRGDPSAYEGRRGPEIFVFGRLAPGTTREEAQAELMAIGRHTAVAFPETHERLRPRVLPYAAQFIGAPALWELHLVQFLVSLLLIVVTVNIAVLVYARTAMRTGEIAVRTALGASRRRIIGQLFVEALVLSAGASAIGLLLAGLALGRVDAFLAEAESMEGLPFWIQTGLSPGSVLYVLGLVVLSAVIVGVLPALQATGRQMQSRLREVGGGTGIQMGRTWTALIVAQVAVAVAVLPPIVYYAAESIRSATVNPGFAADEFLTARLGMEQEIPPSEKGEAYEREPRSRYANGLAEVVKRMEEEPEVSAVTYASRLPIGELVASIEVNGVPSPAGSTGHEIGFGQVDIDLFDTFDMPILAGRQFETRDLDAAATSVIVNRAFVQRVLGGDGALGKRIRYLSKESAEPGDTEMTPWYEIVGIVDDLLEDATESGAPQARLYHPAAPGQLHPVSLVLRVRGAATADVAERLREITAAVDPSLLLREVLPLGEVYRQEQEVARLVALVLGLMALSVLLLSAAGIYALMSFTVTRHRREIGIRSALGADPRHILQGVFSRALRQLALGLAVGVTGAALLDWLAEGELTGGKGPIILPAVAALMLAVGLLAALGPARQGLKIQPMEVLKDE